MRFHRLLSSVCATSAVLSFTTSAQSTAPRPPAPALVIMVTIDQLRPDYLDRYAPQLTGGLDRLLRKGAVFSNAYHDHATTETAPGHATILSGRFPRSTGIVLNSLGVGDPQSPLINSAADGASPFRFQGTTLIDWMMAADPRSRALSVSRKDRGAILPIGRSKQAVFWYTPEGRFTTSRYYGDTLPTWMTQFNDRRLPARYAGAVWKPLLPDSAYTEVDSVEYEGGGTDFVFPHMMPTDTAKVMSALSNYPAMDEVTLAAALAGIEAMHLGDGLAPDLVSISLSTTDAVGHRYGPDSKEIHDQVLRVDRMLGVFFDSLFKIRDSTRIIIALTADHGVTPFPELTVERTHKIVQHVDLSGLAKAYQVALATHGVSPAAFRLEESILLVDRNALRAAHVNADSVIANFAAEARQRRGVARVDDPRALLAGDTINDAITRRWAHTIPPDMPAALVITLEPGDVWGSGIAAQHGQPSDIDAHVPMLFWGTSVTPGRYTTFVRTVDIAPTLATVLMIPPSQRIDGQPLNTALRTTGADKVEK